MSEHGHDDDENPIEKTSIFSSQTLKVQVDGDYQVPPCLVLLVGPAEQMGKQWLIDKPGFTIGRSAEANVQVSEASLSKLHARLDILNQKVFITDLGSTNCTFIDNVKLVPNQAYVLRNNNQIRAGSLVFKFLERGILSETTEKARMQSELENARTVQATLFPSEAGARYRWVKVAGRYRAASECGGDWWWHWANDNKAFALIGDATGHGAAAALITSAARSAIATIENDPTTTIERVYTTLSHAIRSCSGGQLTMSAFIIEVDLNTRAMRYINASHLPAVILPRQDATLTWKTLQYLNDPISYPLGSVESKHTVETILAPLNSRVVLLTDGLTEREDAFGNHWSERLFNNTLIQAQQAHGAAAGAFLDALLTQSDQYAASAPLTDDITIVTVDFD